MELSFCDLRSKEVVNLVDGRCLGHIIDMVFEHCGGKILGIVVPGIRRGIGFFRVREDIFIPFHQVCKIGADTILVELHPVAQSHCPPSPPRMCSYETGAKNDDKKPIYV